MKRFLISIIVSIVFVTAGTIVLFFELSDFDIVKGSGLTADEESFMTTVTMNVKDAPIVIESDDYINIEWRYDDSMKDDAKIMVRPYFSLNRQNNYLEVEDHNHSFQYVIKIGNYILDGLKKHELRIDDHNRYESYDMIIVCSKDTAAKIIVKD